MAKLKIRKAHDLDALGKGVVRAIEEAIKHVEELVVARHSSKLSSSRARAVAKELAELRKVMEAYIINS